MKDSNLGSLAENVQSLRSSLEIETHGGRALDRGIAVAALRGVAGQKQPKSNFKLFTNGANVTDRKNLPMPVSGEGTLRAKLWRCQRTVTPVFAGSRCFVPR